MDKFGYSHGFKSQHELDEISKLKVAKPFDDGYAVVIAKTLTQTANVFQPVNAHGWRGSDIEVLESTEDSRIANTIAKTLIPNIEPSHDGIDDDVLSDMVLPRNCNMSDVSSMLNSISEEQARIISESTPIPVASVEPPKTE